MTRRIMTMFALLAVLGGASAAGLVAPVKWPNFPADPACTPAIPNGVLKLGTKADAKASAQMKSLYDADQAERKVAMNEIVLPLRLILRRKETLELLKGGGLSTGADLLGAAFVFEQGNCPNHYLLAHKLADQALKRGSAEARFIFAVTYDRWLISIKKPQRYGTQTPNFVPTTDNTGRVTQCNFVSLPMDLDMTDAELERYNLPSLADIKRRNDTVLRDFHKACYGVPITSQKFYS